MPRRRAILLVVLLGVRSWSAAAQEPVAAPPRLLEPREFLTLFGWDQRSLEAFRDGEPLDATQDELLLKLLFRLRQYPLAAIDQFSQSPDAVTAIVEHPREARGELFTLSGRVTRVVLVELAEADRKRLQFDAYFRCTFQTNGGQHAVVCALAVPEAWKLDEPIDQRAGARGMFLKTLPRKTLPRPEREPNGAEVTPEDEPAVPLLFVARRVGWYPDHALGKLGMDFGLFDGVKDRTGLNERECFYQMLAAVRRADAGTLEREARDQLAGQVDAWRREAEDQDLDRSRRTAARRALAQAERSVSDIVPLFNDAASQRGKLITLRGEALRAVEVRVNDPDIVSRFGIRRYYEVEIVTDDSQNNPIVCCVAQLPDGMPLGDNINVPVRVTGFFLKSWAYRLGRAMADGNRRQLAPMLIAKTVKRLPEPAAIGDSATIAGALAAAIVAALIVMVYLRRADRRALEAAQKARLELPDRLSLDALGDE